MDLGYAFIKDGHTFTTKGVPVVSSYETIESIYDEYSTINVVGYEPSPNDVIYLEKTGFIGVVRSVKPTGTVNEVSVSQIDNILGRSSFFVEGAFEFGEDRLRDLILSEYTNQTDPFYRLSYINPVAVTHTSSGLNPDVENGVYSIKSYVSKFRRLSDIFTSWNLTQNQLTVKIEHIEKPLRTIDFSNPKFILSNVKFSSKTTAKVTVFCEENSEYTEWYATETGYTQDSTDPTRKVGEWSTLTVSKTADVEDKVKDLFLKNEYSHLIEFSTTEDLYELYTPLTIQLNGTVYSSYVTGIMRKSAGNIININCGELQVKYPYLSLK